jgi:hypothetical protein
METLLQTFKNKAVWITLIAVFVFGVLTDRYVISPRPKYGRDTTYVSLPPPLPTISLGTPGTTVPPRVIYRDREVPDSAVLAQSAWLQSANDAMKSQLDSLMLDRDSLRSKLATLLAPHVAKTPFHFDLLEGKGYMDGYADQGYTPMSQQFGLVLVPTKLYLPEITLTKLPAWWVKPTLVLGGAATTYFITEHNSTGALISGGITLLPLIVEF